MQRTDVVAKKNHYDINNKNISYTIKGNFRDAMVSVTIARLPDNIEEAVAELKDFVLYLKNDGQIGGKMLMRLSPELKKKFGAAPQMAEILRQQHHSAPLKYISKEALGSFIEKVRREKEKVRDKFKSLDGLQCLHSPEDYDDKYESLDHFKKTNSSFNLEVFGVATPFSQSLVTPAKIAQGLYSVEAEKDKVNNEYVKHFSFYDPKTKEFVATLQVFIDDDLAYVSDVIVNKDRRRQGYAQTLAAYAFEFLSLNQPNIQHVYAIGGVAGTSILNLFLRNNQFSLDDVTPQMQQAQGLLPIFVPPGKLLLDYGLKKPAATSALRRNFLLAATATAVVATTVMYVVSESANHQSGNKP